MVADRSDAASRRSGTFLFLDGYGNTIAEKSALASMKGACADIPKRAETVVYVPPVRCTCSEGGGKPLCPLHDLEVIA